MRNHAQALPYVAGLGTTQELYAFAQALGRNYAPNQSVAQLKARLRTYLTMHQNDPLPAAADAILAQAGVPLPQLAQQGQQGQQQQGQGQQGQQGQQPIGGAPLGTPPPTQPAPAGWHWEWHRNWIGRGRYVLIANPVPPTPGTPAPAQTAQADNSWLWLVLVGGLVVVWLFLLFGRPGWIYRVGDDNDSKVSITDSVTQVPTTQTATQPTAAPTAGNGTKPIAADTNSGGGSSGSGSVVIPTKPADLEAVDRSTITAAPLGKWVHPIFKSALFQSSGGNDGQWSWAHTIALITANGGFFRHFEGNDGRFVFRHAQPDATMSFAVLTTSKWKSQFMEGQTQFPDSVNIRTLPGQTVNVYDGNGKLLGSRKTSIGGDLLIQLPDDGVTAFSVTETDPNANFEIQIWFGADDQQNDPKINRFDAR